MINELGDNLDLSETDVAEIIGGNMTRPKVHYILKNFMRKLSENPRIREMAKDENFKKLNKG